MTAEKIKTQIEETVKILKHDNIVRNYLKRLSRENEKQIEYHEKILNDLIEKSRVK